MSSESAKSSADLAAFRANPPVHMNLQEAALYLTVSVRHLWSLASRRRIRVARSGRRLVFMRTELDHYIRTLSAAGA